MPPITATLLSAVTGRPVHAVGESLLPELAGQLAPAGIDTALRLAHFLAQAAEETEAFTRLEENLDYTHAFTIARTFPKIPLARAAALVGRPEALANAAYAGEWGNGDEASGDGWRYRGRGLFDHTFRDNYAELAAALDAPLVAEPDRLLEPALAVRAAITFFKSRGCIALADRDDVEAVTRKINGGTAGLVTRRAYKNAALAWLDAAR